MPLPPAIRFTGHAIVSADGMIADAAGDMPPALRCDADWQRFQAALDRSVLVVLGRIGHRRHPNPGRRRLVLTRAVAGLAPAPDEPLVHLWNPAGIAIAQVLEVLAIAAGDIAVTGGTGTFDHFLGHYDAFVLSEVHGAVLPGGRPCFDAGHPRRVLAAAGLVPAAAEALDPHSAITATRWHRSRAGG